MNEETDFGIPSESMQFNRLRHRLEAMLDGQDSGQVASGFQFLPEIHGNLFCASYAVSSIYGFSGGGAVNLAWVRQGNWSLYGSGGLTIDTQDQAFTMEKATYRLKPANSYAWDRSFAEGFYEKYRQLDVKTFREMPGRAHLAGIRLRTQGMKPGITTAASLLTAPQDGIGSTAGTARPAWDIIFRTETGHISGM